MINPSKAKPIKSFSLTLFMCSFLVAVAIIWSLPTQVLAQNEVRRVEQHLNDINRQLSALQKTVVEHMSSLESQSGDAQGVYSQVDSQNHRALLANMEIRLGAIDHEFRKLTGQVEEMNHRQKQLKTQFENFKADVELRFQDINSGVMQPVEGDSQVQPSGVDVAPPTIIIEDENPQVAPTVEASPEPVLLSSDGPDDSYEQAFGLLRRGNFDGAQRAFTAFLDKYSDHDLAGNAQYWLGETYYARRDYTNAAASFLKGYQDYSTGHKAPDSLLKLGMSLAAMEQVDEACLVFEDIVVRYHDASQSILDSAIREVERNGCS
jgi:tol-pal system protein YbgF